MSSEANYTSREEPLDENGGFELSRLKDGEYVTNGKNKGMATVWSPVVEKPPEVRVPDCFDIEHYIAVDGNNKIYLYEQKPLFNGCEWEIDRGDVLSFNSSSSLILPASKPSEACWQVSELLKVAEVFKQWEAEHGEQAEENQYKVLFDNALKHVDRVFQESRDNPEPILKDYSYAGEEKFEAVVRLAKDYKRLESELSQFPEKIADAILIAGSGSPASLPCERIQLMKKDGDREIDMGGHCRSSLIKTISNVIPRSERW